MIIKGSMVALVTPMSNDGSIDLPALDQLIEWHIASGTKAIIAAGTTGESPTLRENEYKDFITHVVKKVNGRIPVIAGSGTNSTEKTINQSQLAKEAGADACLIVTPYYNKPTQLGLYEHYKTVAENVSLPIILYNVPGRTGCDIQPETVEKLSRVAGIVGIKEATGSVERAKNILQCCEDTFAVYSGDDPTALDLIKSGAHGVISVTANVTPDKMAKLCNAALDSNPELADEINQQLMPLHKNLFVESNPIPAKWALATMGKIQPGIRLPLLPLDEKYHQDVTKALENAGVNLK